MLRMIIITIIMIIITIIKITIIIILIITIIIIMITTIIMITIIIILISNLKKSNNTFWKKTLTSNDKITFKIIYRELNWYS